MSNQIRVGHFQADTGDIFLPLGFIPDYFRLCDINSDVGSVAVAITEWFERMEDDEAGGRREGWTLALSTLGQITLHSDGAGITAYDTGTQFPASGFGAGQLQQWTVNTAMTVRTALAAGSYAKPTVGALDNTGGVADRDAIFEVVATSGDTKTHASTEPVWPSAIGGQVVDDLVTWEKVNTAIFRGGYQGVGIASELTTNDREYYYLALKANDSIDHGDVDGWANGIDQNWS